ncbi:Crp/Fnr family transcriptional regulator [Fulvivirga ligni]|uniref:Crp/Fnr family transcriptional regulator n=1 Tax=Fulvivirga ligni TaxID=2904246 RepID=UPI001F3A2CA1|nr:Crp/Fnr family transcriptional regulator [Fulvivirga ligni]UII24281.1 Crp/Fnr family transcriptional regulator [Fulvivirga ligni]
MNELIDYILKFGHLNSQQIELVKFQVKEMTLAKDDYFSEAQKIPKQVGFVVEGVIRGCYYNNKGEEITKCFISENSLVVDYVNFEAHVASSEYLQACTECRLVVFSKQAWEELSNTIVGWDNIKNKMVHMCMFHKSRSAPVISQDATTRYLEFMETHPTLINRVPLTYIASYLGVTQQSLSRIRKNIQ